MAAGGREAEGTLARRVMQVGRGAGREQAASHCRVTLRCGELQCGPSVRRRLVDRCDVLKEQTDPLVRAVEGARVERCPAQIVARRELLGAHATPRAQQQGEHSRVSRCTGAQLLASQMDSRVALMIDSTAVDLRLLE